MDENRQRQFDLQDRLIDFAISVLSVVDSLPGTKTGNHVAGQLVRSGTAPAANYGEAQSAESRQDFVHKMKIALKELRETLVWLHIAQRKPLVDPPNQLDAIIQECNELISIFVKSVATAQENMKKQ